MLTAIIVFLNEQEEVKHTLDSLYSHLEHEIDIVLINDCSDDGYDYQLDIREYSLRYIENQERLGVAKSRELGVSLSETPYFLFLDAHMRFYDFSWYQILLDELMKDNRCIVCSQTKILKNIGGVVCECRDEAESYGAYVDLFDPLKYFELRWLFTQSFNVSNNNIIDVPCIIGAAYACNKEYWSYLKCLWGLERYGLDEAYICIKVWLEGGRCKLLKNFITGHIYRTTPPYLVEDIFWIYNKILLSYLLLPSFLVSKILSKLKFYFSKDVNLSLIKIYNNVDSVLFYKKYYRDIFVNDFSFYYRLNFYSFNSDKKWNTGKDLLDLIASYVRAYVNDIRSDGLIDGKLGVILFFFHYARFVNKNDYKIVAYDMLLDIVNRMLLFDDNIYELGWVLEYLYQNNFIEQDLYANTRYVDEILMSTYMSDNDLDCFNANAIRYLLARLYAFQTGGIENPFSNMFMEKAYNMSLVSLRTSGPEDNIDLEMKLILFYENKISLDRASIYDLLYIFVPQDYIMEALDLGLDGNSGVGLSIILDNLYHEKLLLNN